MKKRGTITNIFSGIVDIVIGLFLFLFSVLFAVTGLLSNFIKEITIDIIHIFDDFIYSVIDLIKNNMPTFEANRTMLVSVIAGVILILAILHLVNGIKQIRITKIKPETYYQKKNSIVSYFIIDIIVIAICLVCYFLLNLQLILFVIPVGLTVLLKLITICLMSHTIKAEKKKAKKIEEEEKNKEKNEQERQTKQSEALVNEANVLSAELSKLVTLKVEGLITQEEYEGRKAELERKHGIHSTKFNG